MASVFIPLYCQDEENYTVPLEGFIIGFVAQWLTQSQEVDIGLPIFNFVTIPRQDPVFKLPKSCLSHIPTNTIPLVALPMAMQQITLPSITTSCRQLCIGGLCSVIRFLLKGSNSAKCIDLLGFRKGCLMACAEVSVWTRFCEIDLPASTKTFLTANVLDEKLSVPVDVCRFEVHLNEPLRTHNLGKKKYQVIKELQKLNLNEPHQSISKNKSLSVPKLISSEKRDDLRGNDQAGGRPTDEYNPACVTGKLGARIPDLPIMKHEYAESTSMTLADVIIFVCVHHILRRLANHLPNLLPETAKWYERVLAEDSIRNAMKATALEPLAFGGDGVDISIDLPFISKSDLFIRDPKSYSRRIRTFTNQNHINAVIDKLKMEKIVPEYCKLEDVGDKKLDWSQLPAVVLPTFGNLPFSRFDRKCQQLENMALAVCRVAKEGDVIVDFCSGGGHLGILIAHLLPKCQIIMVENKEESIYRALIRAKSFPNACVYQSNMGYFFGKFDIGVALHACGGATDLVLSLSLKVNAAFVICPCCYGSLHDTHLISYPRSSEVSKAGITSKEYYILGHAADQTHENGHKNDQGKYCMGLVDTDRGLLAQALGYRVSLYSMIPSTCSPKNNILVGLPSSK